MIELNLTTVIYITMSFSLGFLLSFLIFSKKKSSEIFILLNDFKKSLDEYKNQNTIYTTEVKNAIKDASNLNKLLTTNQNLKGKFGEDCLEAIIKTCYPEQNINYVKQFRTKNENEEEIKPDYLVNLPNNKAIIIDCKLNIDKYLEYQETKESSKKSEFIKDLNSTINNLSNKKYETAQNITQPDFILMYIPLEPVLTLIYTDKDFLNVIKNANSKNIIIAGNSSILTVIKLTKLLWAQEKQDKNIKNIVSLAQNIYDIIAKHSAMLYGIKQVIEQNTQNFNKEYENFKNNTKLFKTVEELRNYGIQPIMQKSGKKQEELTISKTFLED